MRPRIRIAVTVAAVLVVTSPCLRGQVGPTRKRVPTPAPRDGTITISAALVDRDMQVRPVPLHALVLTGAGPDTLSVRTTTDGKASLSLPAGSYSLSSVAPIDFQGQRYRWKLTVSVVAGATTTLALTNDNATVDPGTATPTLNAP